MNLKKYTYLLLAGTLMTTTPACDDLGKEFAEVNSNPNEAVNVQPELLLPYIQNGISAHRFESWRSNVLHFMPFACHMQSPWIEGAGFQTNDGWIQAYWDRSYQRLVGNLSQMNVLIEAEAKPDMDKRKAISNIMRVLVFHRLTDVWGSVPYSEAGLGMSGILSPTFDNQKDIYANFFVLLDNATKTLEDGTNTFGTQDIFFKGDNTKWIKLANSLRLRLAMRVSNVDPTTADTQIKAVINGDLITTNVDNCVMPHTDDGDQWSTAGNGSSKPVAGFDAHYLAKPLVTSMVNDPRLALFGAGTKDGSIVGYPAGLVPEEERMAWTDDTVEPGNNNTNFSLLNKNSKFSLGADAIHLSAAEVHFLLAEVYLRGIGAAKDMAKAQEHYEAGIAASLAQNGVAATPEFTAGVAFNAADETVAYDQIMRQKWISLVGDGFEAWAELRRTKLPAFAAKEVFGAVPSRVKYPSSLATLNPLGYNKGVADMGEDTESTKVWWDVK